MPDTQVVSSRKRKLAAAFTPPADHKASFVLPIDRNDRVLLVKEEKGKKELLSLLGGKVKHGENIFQTAARHAKIESGCGRGKGGLTATTISRIERGAGLLGPLGLVSRYEKSGCVAFAHDLVVPKDSDVETRFPRGGFVVDDSSSKMKTKELDLVWVPIAQLKDRSWREKNLHFIASVLCARMMVAGRGEI